MRVHQSCLGQFELLGATSSDYDSSDSEQARDASKAMSSMRLEETQSAEDWEPPHWIPLPVPKDFDIKAAPWIRPPAPRHVLTNVHVVDTEKAKLRKNMTVVVEKGEIISVEPAKDGEKGIDCGGLYLCPGLIDCHTHITATPGMSSIFSASETECALKAPYVLKGMLWRGFTTIRDVGGATKHYANATAEWLTPGPRIFQGGPIMSQTGGHGDLATGGCCNPPATRIADGVDECTKVARTLMKNGADHIKICSSGGVSSETDKLESTQFTVAEIKAICDTVRNMGGCGVASHCFTVEGARNAIEAGVWSIEHGSLLDEPTLRLMAEKGVHLTPTLIVAELMSKPPYSALLSPASRKKLADVMERGFASLKKAHDAGVNIAYGTDCFSSMQPGQLSEFELRARYLPSSAVLQHATVNAARVLKMEGKIGVIKKGAAADLILLRENPLEDVASLNRPKENLRAVIKDGRCVRSSVKGLRVEVPLV